MPLRVQVTNDEEAFVTSPSSLVATSTLLENDHLRVELNGAGDIIRIYDKANQREVLSAGHIANQFQAFEDRPMNWDAWDLDVFYDDKMWTSDPASSVQVVEAGPLRATLEIQRRILESVQFPGETLVFTVEGDNYRFGRKLRFRRGSRIL